MRRRRWRCGRAGPRAPSARARPCGDFRYLGWLQGLWGWLEGPGVLGGEAGGGGGLVCAVSG